MAIQSFGNKETEDFFIHGKIKKGTSWKNIRTVAFRKLDMLEYAQRLIDLGSPPKNNLEKLKRNLKGFYSIRINDQWGIIFKWTNPGPTLVKITDYHDN